MYRLRLGRKYQEPTGLSVGRNIVRNPDFSGNIDNWSSYNGNISYNSNTLVYDKEGVAVQAGLFEEGAWYEITITCTADEGGELLGVRVGMYGDEGVVLSAGSNTITVTRQCLRDDYLAIRSQAGVALTSVEAYRLTWNDPTIEQPEINITVTSDERFPTLKSFSADNVEFFDDGYDYLSIQDRCDIVPILIETSENGVEWDTLAFGQITMMDCEFTTPKDCINERKSVVAPIDMFSYETILQNQVSKPVGMDIFDSFDGYALPQLWCSLKGHSCDGGLSSDAYTLPNAARYIASFLSKSSLDVVFPELESTNIGSRHYLVTPNNDNGKSYNGFTLSLSDLIDFVWKIYGAYPKFEFNNDVPTLCFVNMSDGYFNSIVGDVEVDSRQYTERFLEQYSLLKVGFDSNNSDFEPTILQTKLTCDRKELDATVPLLNDLCDERATQSTPSLVYATLDTRVLSGDDNIITLDTYTIGVSPIDIDYVIDTHSIQFPDSLWLYNYVGWGDSSYTEYTKTSGYIFTKLSDASNIEMCDDVFKELVSLRVPQLISNNSFRMDVIWDYDSQWEIDNGLLQNSGAAITAGNRYCLQSFTPVDLEDEYLIEIFVEYVNDTLNVELLYGFFDSSNNPVETDTIELANGGGVGSEPGYYSFVADSSGSGVDKIGLTVKDTGSGGSVELKISWMRCTPLKSRTKMDYFVTFDDRNSKGMIDTLSRNLKTGVTDITLRT